MSEKPIPSPRAQAFMAWMKDHGTNTKRVAIKSGVPYTTLASFVQGGTQSLKGANEDRIAEAMGVSTADLFSVVEAGDFPSRAEPTAPALLYIRGTVQAGAWLEQSDMDQTEPERFPAAPDPRYPTGSQWLSRVRGDSMNALTRNGQPAGILDGDLVHCVDAFATNYQPVTGDLVEAERRRAGRAEVEVTLKQVEVIGDRVLLWPRSTNPRWAQPIEALDGAAPGDMVEEVFIRARVINVIRTW